MEPLDGVIRPVLLSSFQLRRLQMGEMIQFRGLGSQTPFAKFQALQLPIMMRRFNYTHGATTAEI
jgi:hypothetical protein